MQQNSTDLIAKTAWTVTLERWKEFMLLPAVVSVVFAAAVALSVNFTYAYGSQGTVGLVLFIIYIAYLVFVSCFYTAVSKWCSDLHAGKSVIDIEEGLRYGLSRFWGKLGTQLLTALKIALWSLLLIFPGLYKALMYSQSVKISQLEGISGGDANRLSEKLVGNAGILRTLGNFLAIQTVTMLAIYLYIALIFPIVGGIISSGAETLAGIVGGVLFIGGMIFMMTFLVVFTDYQYLIYRDENKAEMAKMVKTLKSLS